MHIESVSCSDSRDQHAKAQSDNKCSVVGLVIFPGTPGNLCDEIYGEEDQQLRSINKGSFFIQKVNGKRYRQ